MKNTTKLFTTLLTLLCSSSLLAFAFGFNFPTQEDWENYYEELVDFEIKLYCYNSAVLNYTVSEVCESYGWVVPATRPCAVFNILENNSYAATNEKFGQNAYPIAYCPPGDDGKTSCEANPTLCSNPPLSPNPPAPGGF